MLRRLQSVETKTDRVVIVKYIFLELIFQA